MKDVALLAIRCYQRWLSPRKGFCCAYRAYTGGASCSTLGARAIRRFGVWRGLQVLDGRLQQCRRAHEARVAARWRHPRQAGDCDCDLPCDGPCDGCDACDACDCDWRRKEKRGKKGRKDNHKTLTTRALPSRYARAATSSSEPD